MRFRKKNKVTTYFSGLDREQLIKLALLTGSDYTEGIESVGPVTALEIMGEFPGDGLEPFRAFRDWLVRVQAKNNAPPENKIRAKMRNLNIKPGKLALLSHSFKHLCPLIFV